MSKLLLAIAFLTCVTTSASARPYYAAMKGLSCAACHVAPAGGGMRKLTDKSPGRLTDNIHLGADLRVCFSQIEKSKVSTFAVARSAFYVAAEPKPGLQVVLSPDYVNNTQAAQMYGMWKAQEGLPYYVRAGRFFLPYGILWDDPDNTYLLHTAPFAPAVGFNMAPTQSDTGVEIGLAPKKDYFVNLALTNGRPAGGGANQERKAVTARAGWITEYFMIGGTYHQSRTSTGAFGTKQLRFGPLAWVKAGPAALIYEGGFGSDKSNSGGPTTRLAGHALELDASPTTGWIGRLRFDSSDPSTSVPGDDRQRYSVGVERLMESLSFEVQYRIFKEAPSVQNNQLFVQTHLWF